MNFVMTAALLDEVIDALETQGKEPFFHGEALPPWGNSEGYALREEFATRVSHDVASEEMRQALHSGRGAFRAFKDVLKAYPQVEKAWHRYKHARMASYVWQWYDGLCDKWGLEHLARDEGQEGSEDLLQEDFVFERMLSASDWQEVREGAEKAIMALGEGIPQEVKQAAALKWRRENEALWQEGRLEGVICRKSRETAAGSIAWSREGEVAFVVSLFVLEEWRLLGIGERLLNECVEEGRNDSKAPVRFVAASLPAAGVALETLLQKAGFEKKAALWVLARET